jgi:hypothetical protein
VSGADDDDRQDIEKRAASAKVGAQPQSLRRQPTADRRHEDHEEHKENTLVLVAFVLLVPCRSRRPVQRDSERRSIERRIAADASATGWRDSST